MEKMVDIEKAKKYVFDNTSKKKEKNYVKANIRFNTMMNALHNRNIFSFFINGVKLCFTSKYYLNKIYRLALLSLNS